MHIDDKDCGIYTGCGRLNVGKTHGLTLDAETHVLGIVIQYGNSYKLTF